MEDVKIINPNHTYIDQTVVIGHNTVIYPGTFIRGNTVIGCFCTIGPNCQLDDVIIEDHATINSSVIKDAKIGSYTTIGPYTHIRPGTDIGEHCKIGAFAEVKNSKIGHHTSAAHLAYIGDSDIGCHVTLGCGSVTVNYDGKKKARTTIKDNAFIGCNTNLIAPVTIHEGAYTAAGSTITQDVPANALGIARERQANKLNWRK